MAEFRRSKAAAIRDLTRLGQNLDDVVGKDMSQYGEFILAEAAIRAPVKTGALRASGVVTEPFLEEDAIVVRVGFNIVYARIQDEGGIIRPVRAKALFIPLRDGVRPGQPGLVFGRDFVLAKEVVLVGNTYWSATLDENLPDAARIIGQRVTALLRELPQRRTP